MKKLINAPADVLAESLDGFAAAHGEEAGVVGAAAVGTSTQRGSRAPARRAT